MTRFSETGTEKVLNKTNSLRMVFAKLNKSI